MRICFLILLSFLLLGCMSAADYMTPPAGAVTEGSGPYSVNPDGFKVDPNKYPKFTASADVDPPDARDCWIGGCSPRKMAPILTTDIWSVTHIVRNKYLIESDSYNERQCLYMNKLKENPAGGGVNIFGHCLRALEFGIYVTPTGAVDGGWQILPGSQKIFSARETFLAPDVRNTKMWPADFHFVGHKNV